MARLISVIVTVYNRAGMIAAAIASVTNAGSDDIEVIVVDDGSSDGSAEIVEAIDDPRIRLVRHPANRGIPAARNSGLAAARGDYIAWLDSDDLARPGRFEIQAAFLDRHRDIAMIGGCAGRVGASGQPRRGARVPLLAHEDIRAQLLFRSGFQQSSIMGRAAILKAFPYRPEFPVCEDLDMFVRLTRDHRVANLPKVLVDRRLHDGQTVQRESAAIRAAKRVIFTGLLERLGITPGDEDIERHVTLGNLKNAPVSRQFLDWSEAWLARIVAANRVAQVHETVSLDFVIGRLWLLAARNAARGPDRAHALARLAASPLTRGLASRRAGAWLAAAAAIRIGRR